MNAEQTSTGSGGPGRTGTTEIPLLPAVICFRVCIGIVACLLGAVLLGARFDEQAWHAARTDGFCLSVRQIWSLVVLFVTGIWSLVVAVGLLRRRLGAAHWALVFDAVVVLAVVTLMARELLVFMTEGGRLSDILFVLAHAAVAALVFALEAGCLVRTLWRWRYAWPAVGLLAVVLAFLVAIPPRTINKRLISHVGPLLAYVDAHWVRIPPEASISVEAERKMRGPHTDRVDVETEFVYWSIEVEHGKDGRWHFPAGPAERSALVGCRNPGLNMIEVTSLPAARKLLRDCGVVDRDLGPGRLERPDHPGYYQFWSPGARGTYAVAEYGDIQLELKDPVDVDQ